MLACVVLCAASSSPVAAATWRPYHLPPAAHDVPIVTADCGGSAGCYTHGDTVTLSPAAQGGNFTILEDHPRVPLAEVVYLHELGHWFDAHAMTPATRTAFETIIQEAQDWTAGPNAPAEQFAQAFALCALYPVVPKRWPTLPTWGLVAYGYGPTRTQQRAACALITGIR